MDTRKRLYLMLNSQSIIRFAPYPFWGLICIVTTLLLIELTPSPSGWPYTDKVEHITAFAALGLFGQLSYPRKNTWVYAGLVIYGLLMEWMQSTFTLTREASVYDWIADIIGVLLSALLVYVLTKNNADRI